MNKVQIYRVTTLKGQNSPYRVKWRVDGHDKTRSFKKKILAENFHRELQKALENGNDFSSATGLPEVWAKRQITFAECASEYTAANWRHWEGASRRSTFDALTNSVLILVRRKNAPFPRPFMAKVVREFLLKPDQRTNATGDAGDALAWILKNSWHLSEINQSVLEATLDSLNKTLDRKSDVVPSTFKKRRQALNATLEHAVYRKYLSENPLTRVKFRVIPSDEAVDPLKLPSPSECRKLQAKLKTMGQHGLMVSIFFACIWLAGLRPSEVLALKRKDIHFDNDTGSKIYVSSAIVEIGYLYSDDGSSKSLKSPKARGRGHIRWVPIADELAKVLAEYTTGFKDDELLFKARRSKRNKTDVTDSEQMQAKKTASLSMFEEYWAKVRPEDLRLYDLRHVNASMLIYAGLNIIEVASRLGHSVQVCSRIYLHLLNTPTKPAHDALEDYLAKH